jgi:hypothetical protein
MCDPCPVCSNKPGVRVVAEAVVLAELSASRMLSELDAARLTGRDDDRQHARRSSRVRA